MKKFTSLAFLAYVLLFLIVVSAASPDDDEVLEKRTNTCSQQYKRNVLGKRTNVKKCPCALAQAIFEGGVSGLTIFAQDECGSTTVTGFFSKGLDDPGKSNYTFVLTDDCGNIVKKLGTLGATFTDGGTKPFTQKFEDFNLNCDKQGLLLLPSAKNKRTYCRGSYRKRDGGAEMEIYENGEPYGNASPAALNQL